MLRFYKGGLTIKDIRDMTFSQFGVWMKEISVISELESGENKSSGAEAKRLAISDPAIRKV